MKTDNSDMALYGPESHADGFNPFSGTLTSTDLRTGFSLVGEIFRIPVSNTER